MTSFRLRSALLVFNILSRPIGWQWRDRWRRITFHKDRNVHRAGEIARTGAMQSVTFIALVRSTFLPALGMTAACALLEIVARRLDCEVADASRAGLDPIALLLGNATAGATLLALYYSMLSSVLASSYATTHANVRDLFLQDVVARTYTNALMLLIMASLAFCVEALVIGRPSTMCLAGLTCFSAACVLLLVPVARRLFDFFDPATVRSSLAR